MFTNDGQAPLNEEKNKNFDFFPTTVIKYVL